MNYISNVNIEKIGNAKNPSLVYYNFDIINSKTSRRRIIKRP
jgi:hypothetical protein